MDGALFQVAHKALVGVAAVNFQTADGMALAVKGSGVVVAGIADGRPVVTGGDGDVACQHRFGASILLIELGMGLIPVDQGGEPEELPGVGDLVDAAVLFGGLVLAALGAEAVVIRMEQRIAILSVSREDNAVAAVQHRNVVLFLSVVQVLVPDQVALTGGAVEQVRHLAGGERRVGFGGGGAFAGAADGAGTGGIQIVAVGDGILVTALVVAADAVIRRAGVMAVGDGAAVAAADAAGIFSGGEAAGVIAVGDGGVCVGIAADAAHIFARGHVAGVAAAGDNAVGIAADAAGVLGAAGDRACVGAVLDGAAFLGTAADAAGIPAAAGDRAAVGAASDGDIPVAADAARAVTAGDRAGIGAVPDGNATGAVVNIADDAAYISLTAAIDIAVVGAAGEGGMGVTADAAHRLRAAVGHLAAVGAVFHGAQVVAADAAQVALAVDRALVGAAGDGAGVIPAADAAGILAAGDRAAFAQGQVLDGARAQIAHKALVLGATALDFQALDGVARAVKGAGVGIGTGADGGPGLALGDGDVCSQHRAGSGILGVKLRVGLVAVDQRREPQQVAGVGDLVDAAVVLCCGLVLFAAGAEAIRRIIAVDSS